MRNYSANQLLLCTISVNEITFHVRKTSASMHISTREPLLATKPTRQREKTSKRDEQPRFGKYGILEEKVLSTRTIIDVKPSDVVVVCP